MIQTFEAVINPQGEVSLLVPTRFDKPRRALVTILDEDPTTDDDITRMSEPILAVDWNRPEEDAAWAHLQPDR